MSDNLAPVLADVSCAVDDCDRWPIARGWCSAHYQRWRRTGSPIGSPGKSSHAGSASHRWAGDTIGYKAAVRRVRIARGPATAHLCVDCVSRRAFKWTYRAGSDPDERRDSQGRVWCLDVEAWTARCASCAAKLWRLGGR